MVPSNIMLNHFPDSVRKDMLPELVDSQVSFEQLVHWQGEQARELTPLGYCGNPANYNTDEAWRVDQALASSMVDSIERYLSRRSKRQG